MGRRGNGLVEKQVCTHQYLETELTVTHSSCMRTLQTPFPKRGKACRGRGAGEHFSATRGFPKCSRGVRMCTTILQRDKTESERESERARDRARQRRRQTETETETDRAVDAHVQFILATFLVVFRTACRHVPYWQLLRPTPHPPHTKKKKKKHRKDII